MTVLSDVLINDLCTKIEHHRYVAHVDRHTGPMIAQRDFSIHGHPNGKPMIEDFIDHQVKTDKDGKKIVSYGLTSAGYDVRLARDFKVFTDAYAATIDPLNPGEQSDNYFTEVTDRDSVIVPPRSYVLGHTLEYFNMPREVLAVCLGKSTWARTGLLINVTPIEPEFEGQIVIEIANGTPNPIVLHSGMGIAQFVFHRIVGGVKTSYADRDGKYQKQTGITTARL